MSPIIATDAFSLPAKENLIHLKMSPKKIFGFNQRTI